MIEDKRSKFKRLAKLRAERILKDLHLLGNLSNTSAYDYTDAEVKAIFSAIDEELRKSKFSFSNKKKTSITL